MYVYMYVDTLYACVACPGPLIGPLSAPLSLAARQAKRALSMLSLLSLCAALACAGPSLTRAPAQAAWR